MLGAIEVTEDKEHGGKRPGAGRPREAKTAFALWAEEKKYSSKDLAELLGIKTPMVNHLLGGRARPSLDVLAKLDTLARDDKGCPLFPAKYWTSLDNDE